jgi:ABC-type spermidine/putrescine transport system permease subunit I
VSVATKPATGPARRTREPKAWTAQLSRRTGLLMAAPLTLAVLLLVVYPILRLLYDSLTLGDGPGNYVDAVSSGAMRRAFLFTFATSAAVTVLSVGIGASLAWTLRRARNKVVTALVWAVVLLPFWMGVVVKNYAFALLFAREGLVNQVLGAIGLIDEPLQLLYTPTAVVVGMTYTMIPYAVLALYPSMAAVDLEMMNAADGLGASRRRTFTSILLPLVLPGFIAATAIVFAISIGFYVTPVLLGGAQTPFIATVIGDDIFTFFDYPRAAAASVLLLAIALLAIGAALKAVGIKAIRGGLG